MGMFGRIGLYVQKKVDNEVKEIEDQRKFNQEYDARLKEERRKAQLANAPKIARAEADMRLKEARTGKPRSSGTGGGMLGGIKDMYTNMNQRAQDDLNFAGNRTNKHKSGGGMLGGGVPDDDDAFLFGQRKQKAQGIKKKRTSGTTIIIRK